MNIEKLTKTAAEKSQANFKVLKYLWVVQLATPPFDSS